MLGICIESFLRGKHYYRCDIAVRKRHERFFSEAAADLGKSTYEALDLAAQVNIDVV